MGFVQGTAKDHRALRLILQDPTGAKSQVKPFPRAVLPQINRSDFHIMTIPVVHCLKMMILFPTHDLNFILKPLPGCASVYLKMFILCITAYLKFAPKIFPCLSPAC